MVLVLLICELRSSRDTFVLNYFLKINCCYSLWESPSCEGLQAWVKITEHQVGKQMFNAPDPRIPWIPLIKAQELMKPDLNKKGNKIIRAGHMLNMHKGTLDLPAEANRWCGLGMRGSVELLQPCPKCTEIRFGQGCNSEGHIPHIWGVRKDTFTRLRWHPMTVSCSNSTSSIIRHFALPGRITTSRQWSHLTWIIIHKLEALARGKNSTG